MRRLLVALLLPLLLIAQQGAFVHGLEHLTVGAGTSKSSDERPLPGDQFCEKCFAFAHIGAAVDVAVTTFASVVVCAEAIVFNPPGSAPVYSRLPRSRGPPAFL